MSYSNFVKKFLQESYENLDRLDRELVGLEKNPRDTDALASVFRTIHTIKGSCGFLGLDKLEKVVANEVKEQAAESTSRGAGDAQKASVQLVETSAQLRKLVEQFKIEGDGTRGGNGYSNLRAA